MTARLLIELCLPRPSLAERLRCRLARELALCSIDWLDGLVASAQAPA